MEEYYKWEITNDVQVSFISTYKKIWPIDDVSRKGIWN